MGGNLAALLAGGCAIGLIIREKFSLAWLIVAAILLAFNDILLTSAHGFFPNFIGGEWLWQGKLLALAGTLAIAALPSFGWSNCGLRLSQEPGSLKAAIPASMLYCVYVIGIALLFPQGKTNAEEIAFQLTMPGFEEEPFWRGIFL